jgi:hypothetical protein
MIVNPSVKEALRKANAFSVKGSETAGKGRGRAQGRTKEGASGIATEVGTVIIAQLLEALDLVITPTRGPCIVEGGMTMILCRNGMYCAEYNYLCVKH